MKTDNSGASTDVQKDIKDWKMIRKKYRYPILEHVLSLIYIYKYT